MGLLVDLHIMPYMLLCATTLLPLGLKAGFELRCSFSTCSDTAVILDFSSANNCLLLSHNCDTSLGQYVWTMIRSKYEKKTACLFIAGM